MYVSTYGVPPLSLPPLLSPPGRGSEGCNVREPAVAAGGFSLRAGRLPHPEGAEGGGPPHAGLLCQEPRHSRHHDPHPGERSGEEGREGCSQERQTEWWTVRQTDRQTNRQTDEHGQADMQTDVQTDERTVRTADIHVYVYKDTPPFRLSFLSPPPFPPSPSPPHRSSTHSPQGWVWWAGLDWAGLWPSSKPLREAFR